VGNSFYGGPRGQDFVISYIFDSRVEMASDLALKMSSTIGVGSYVFISYGLPGEDKYV
jgi:hypothetical protein